MTESLLVLALALAAWGQAPAASTDTVTSSTAATVGVATVTVSEPPAAPAPAPMPEPPRVRRPRLIVHKDAGDWEPFSVVSRPDSGPERSSFERQVRKVRGRYRGRPSPAKAAARSYPAKEDRWLVVSVYPAALRPKRMHLEARFLIQEGYIEEVKIAAVSVVGGTYSPQDDKEDSFTLRAKGVDFVEEAPGSAEVELAVVDPSHGRDALNSGRVKNAAFGDWELGFVNFGWAVTGVSGVKPPQAVKSSKPKPGKAKPAKRRAVAKSSGPKPALEEPAEEEEAEEPPPPRPAAPKGVSGVQIRSRSSPEEPPAQKPEEAPAQEEPSEAAPSSDEPDADKSSAKKPAKEDAEQDQPSESDEEGQPQPKDPE